MEVQANRPIEWYAVYTNIRCELRAQMGLRERGLEAFMPSMTVWVKHARTKTRSKRPLFTRYIFVALDRDEPQFHIVRSTDGVEAIIGVQGKPFAISPKDMAKLQQAEEDGLFDQTKTAPIVTRGRFSTGQRVKIVAGVLQGFDAQVVKVLGRKTVRILYMLFGRAGEANIDPLELEAIPEEPEPPAPEHQIAA